MKNVIIYPKLTSTSQYTIFDEIGKIICTSENNSKLNVTLFDLISHFIEKFDESSDGFYKEDNIVRINLLPIFSAFQISYRNVIH